MKRMTVVEAGKTVWKQTKLNKLNRLELMCLAARLIMSRALIVEGSEVSLSRANDETKALRDEVEALRLHVESLKEGSKALTRMYQSMELDLKTANGKIVSANQLLGDRAAELRDVRLELDLRWQATRTLEDRIAALVKSNDNLLRENVHLDRPHWVKGAALMATGALAAVIALGLSGALVAP